MTIWGEGGMKRIAVVQLRSYMISTGSIQKGGILPPRNREDGSVQSHANDVRYIVVNTIHQHMKIL